MKVMIYIIVLCIRTLAFLRFSVNFCKILLCSTYSFYTIGVCNANTDMMHTMIQGGSGTGKTMLARILGEIYWKMGILDNSKEECNHSLNTSWTLQNNFCLSLTEATYVRINR